MRGGVTPEVWVLKYLCVTMQTPPSIEPHPEYDLGQRIRHLREKRGLSQVEFAERIFLSQSMVAQIELGKNKPSLESLEKIAAELDVELATLFAKRDVYVFDLKRLKARYDHAEKLTPILYMSLGKILQYAKDIGFSK